MPEADLLLENGTVVTLDRRSTVADAVAVRDGRVVSVGARAAVARDVGPRTQRVDLRGRTVVPGFFDAHPHIARAGLMAGSGIPIAGLRSVGEIVDAVRRAAAAAPPGQWIVLAPMGSPPYGCVSRPAELEEGRFPTRHDLDSAAPDHPVYIRACWGRWADHPCPSVANSRALMQAGIGRSTAAPDGVEIARDDRGEPTGVFLERNHVPVVEHALLRVPQRWGREGRLAGARAGVRACGPAGTTSVFEGHGLTPTLIDAYRELDADGGLPVRLHAPFSVPSATSDDWQLVEFFHRCAEAGHGPAAVDGAFRVEGINLGGPADRRMAELIASGYAYEEWAGHFYQAMGPGRFVRLGVLATRMGLRINRVTSHASFAASPWRDLEYALATFEAIDRDAPIRDRRWTLIHVSAATPSQLGRIRRLGVTVTVTPGLLAMAGYGRERREARDAPVRELLDRGIPVALGTNGVWPSMLWVMWALLTGRDEGARTPAGNCGLTREDVLRLAVQSGHRLTWAEDRRGSLEVGKNADLVVLGGNPLTCPEDEIKDLSVDLTVVGGRIVHERASAGVPVD
jgi:predicted amidohydrolase YtcJ